MKKRVIAKKGKESKIKNFYPFLYKDEISGVMGSYENGEIVEVVDADLNFIAKGYINDNSNIFIRILTTDKNENIDKKFINDKIKKAYEKRKNLENETNCVRIFFSEADGLSGLIVDKFDKYLSVQFRTLGIERFRKEIIESLQEIVKPEGIYERSDTETRTKEGIEEKTGTIFGEIPDKIIMEDNGVKFYVDIINGQKTGFFLDQRDSRKFISNYITKDTVFLDVFSSSGGFSMAALKNGAKKSIAIDKSPEALEMAKLNYELNQFTQSFETIEGDAFEILKNLQNNKERYDVIILDPPSLIKKKEDRTKGRDFFFDLCNDSFKILKSEGILGVCTCAYHVHLQDLIEVTRMAASENGIKLEVLGISYQPSDHPWILHMPETLYLKCLWVRIVK